jgi:cell division protein FtsB
MSSPAVQLRERFPRLADDAVTRARLTVVPRRRVRAARMPFVTLVSLLLLGGVVGLLCFNTQMQQASFAATSLESEASNLAAREQTLHDELQQLRSPQQLGERAQQAGMVLPDSACTVRLAEQTAASDCTPATGDTTPRLQPEQPKKPRVLDPAPIIVTVPAVAGAGRHGHHGRHVHHGHQGRHHQARDTARR